MEIDPDLHGLLLIALVSTSGGNAEARLFGS